MNNKPKISVTVPTYNSAKYIKKTLNSICSQTYKNIEIIVVDNASEDNTEQIVKSISDSRIKYFRNNVNIGAANNFNKCIELADSEIMCIYHSDDIYEPEIIEKQVNFLMKYSDLGAVFALDKVIDENDRFIENGVDIPKPLKNRPCWEFDKIYRYMLADKKNFFVCPTFMCKTKIFKTVGKYSSSGKYGDWIGGALDTAMWLRIAEKYKVGIVPERLIRRRLTKDSGTGKYVSSYTTRANHFLVLDDFLKSTALKKPLQPELLKQYEFNKYYDDVVIAKNYIWKNEQFQALKLLIKSFSLKKFFWSFKTQKNLVNQLFAILIMASVIFKSGKFLLIAIEKTKNIKKNLLGESERQNKMISVLFLDNSPHLGGGEWFLIDLANKLMKKNVNVTIAVTFKNRLEKLKKFGIPAVLFESGTFKTINPGKFFSAFLRPLLELKKIVKEKQIDIIQSNTVRMHILASFLKIITRKKSIWVLHMYDFPKFLLLIFSFFTDEIVFVSETLKKYYYNFVLQKNKMKVIYNSIDFEKLDKNLIEHNNFLTNKYPQSINKKKIGLIGRIEPLKGQEILIKAIPDIIKKYNDIHFFIIGEPHYNEKKYFENVKQLAVGLEVEKYITWTGYIEKKFSVINDLDIIIQPSILPETFGRVLIEAMAMEKIVIATNMGAFKEIVIPNKNGFLFENGNYVQLSEVIIYILNNFVELSYIKNNAYKYVKANFDVQRTYNEFLELYN